MDFVRSIPEITTLMDNADVVSIKTIESTKSMRSFIAAKISYMPGWMLFLYKVRAVFVKLLGIESDAAPQKMKLTADDITFTPGDPATFFTVTGGKDELWWLCEATEKHLTCWLGVAVEPLENGNKRYHSITIVKYRHWTGPVYYNAIRPFHHIVIHCMLKHAA